MNGITESMVQEYEEQGVIVLRGVFRDWVDTLARGVEAVMADPSPLERSYWPSDGSAPFFQDYCNWQRVEAFRSFAFDSPAAAVAARLMRSKTARFFHDHVLVKQPGSSTVTPWHQDQPYYCVEGHQSVSFWTPLDPVSREVTLECVAGSHRWSKTDFRPKRFDGTPLYKDDSFVETPDIDAQRDNLSIAGWAMEPGDAVAFNFRTIHGAPANKSALPRRVVSSRWVGDDARWAERSGPTSPPFPHLHLADGAPFDAPDFPLVFPVNSRYPPARNCP